MSATTKIEDKNSVKEAREAEVSDQEAPTTSEGKSEPFSHKATVKDDENGGKPEITPSKQASEESPTNIVNADVVNKNTMSESLQQIDEIPTDIKHIVRASGDSQIQSKNTTIGGQDNTNTEITGDLMENAEETHKDNETVAKVIMEGSSSAKITGGNTTDVSSTFIDNKSVNDNDITSQDVSNDVVIKNFIEPLSQCTDTKAIEPVSSQSRDDCNETDTDMKIDNEDDELELKWDDDNDDDLIKDDMECDPSNEEHAETLADESSMDVDFDNDEKDVLNDNTIVNNDKNDVELTVGTTIQNIDKETNENVQNDENTDVINDNTTEINSNAATLNENKEMKVMIEPQKQLESPTDEISSSQDVSMEDSELINKDHGVHKPDVMLEIPTQELIDIDDTDLSINLDQSVESLDVDEKLIDSNDMPVDDKMTEGEVTTVKDVELGITADTNMQENLKDLVENVTEKVSDDKSGDPFQPSTSCISKITTETSEILSGVTDSVVKSVCSDDLGDIADVSGSVDPVRSGEEVLKVSDSAIPTVSPNNMIEDSINKVPEMTDSYPEVITSSDMPEVTDNLGTLVSSDKMVPDTTSQLPDVSETMNPVVTTSNDKLEVTEISGTLVSSSNVTLESTDKVPESSEDMNLQATTSNDITEVTDNSDKLVSSKSMSPDTSTKVSDLPALSHELPAVADRIDMSVPSNKMTPETTNKLPQVSDFNPDTSTSVLEVSNSIDISVSSNKMTPETTNKIPQVSDSNPDTSTSVLQVSDSIDISVSSNKITPDTTNKVPEVSDSNPDTSTSVLQVSDSIDISVSSNKMIPDTSDELPEVSDSLGLLAESSRVMEDDDDQEDDDDADEDDDFDQDESSNQITTAEHSEDSNAQQSESEANKDEKETDISPPVESEREFQFMISNVESQGMDKIDMECEEPTEDVVETNEELIEDIVEADEAMEPLDEKLQVTDSQADIETVRLSDTSDNEADADTAKPTSEQTPSKTTKEIAAPSEQSKQSPSKTRKLSLSSSEQPVFNIVDLEESSSEDDIQEVNKKPETTPEVADAEGVTSVNLPNDIEVMCTSAGSTSEIVTKEGEVVISGVPKPPPIKPARLNTSEVSIKTAGTGTESTLVIPEAKTKVKDTTKEARVKPKLCLEIFSLDSDEEDASSAKEQPSPPTPAPQEPQLDLPPVKCINPACSSAAQVPRAAAAAAARLHYGCARKGKALICQTCACAVDEAKQDLIRGIKDFCPLLELGADKLSQELVEISDSESEDESEEPKPPSETIGEKGAKLLEENLAAIINETWRKYNMDARMKDTHDILDAELLKLENESKEIDAMLNECQAATDRLRNELYATFDRGADELPPHVIYDTPMYNYVGPEIDKSTTPLVPAPEPEPLRQSKRRMSTAAESPAKKPAIPLGYTPLETDTAQHNVQDTKTDASDVDNKMDDDKDVSVVRLSAEAAPADLPPAGGGPAARAPLRAGQAVYAMRNSFGPWLKGKILEVQPKLNVSCFTMCRVKFDHKVKNPCKILAGRCLAYPEPAEVRMTIGTRIIALYKDPGNVKREQFFSGVVAEIPNPVNNYRYLVFFDDGYAQYVQHAYTRLVCESSSLVWEEVHPFSRQFVKDYLMAYPERPMVRLHEGQSLKTEWNGKWWSSRVLVVDASLAQVLFLEDGRKEWIYRGSTRLAPLYLEFQAAGRHRQRPMPRSKAATGTNMPYVEYTRSDEQDGNKQQDIQTQQLQNEELRRQRAVAKKSTAAPPPPAPPAPPAHPAHPAPHNLDTVTSRVVYYTPKAAVKPYKMVPHSCGPKCKRTDVLSLKELRTYNPLAKPLLSGWERQIVRFKGHKDVMYRAPCGRRLRDMRELHRYLRITQSELPVDLFDFFHGTHCLAEFVLNKCLVGKKDLSHGKENVPVPCVNYYDDSLPEFCSYNTERTPTAGVPLNLDPDFLCGCDCTDDCMDKSKCACWRMTLEGAHTIGLEGPNVGYVYKRLPEPLPSGIYECNSRCKCKATCLNRVAQHPLQLKLQVFKTLNRGWGIRALNDIPKGAFLCVYAGNLLTDATANLDGLNEGDEYLAELDYIEVVEQMKEGYEEDIPSADKRLDKKESGKRQEEEEESTSSAPSSDEETRECDDKEDGDFQPGYHFGLGVMEFNKALRKRNKAKKEEDKGKEKEKESTKDNEDCITISDDEEVREPSRFTAQAGMGANQFISKYRSVRSHFGMDEACYIMDAKVQGNIGRYLNHSCTPNVFVQNVFVDTHDPRFPWVAFFALSHIRAGTELTWNYNYDVGSVPGKVLYCFCGAPNCRGRLL